MSKHIQILEIDRVVLARIQEKALSEISSDLDFIQRMTFARNAWDTIEKRERRKFEAVEELQGKVDALKNASSAIAGKDYDVLRKIHFYEAQLEKAKAQALPFEQLLDEIVDAMTEIESIAKRNLGYIPHNFLDD